MSRDLSPRAERLAQLLRLVRRKRLPLHDVWRLFDEADPASRMSLARRRDLVAVLEELASAEVIHLPSNRSYDRTEAPAAPRFITIAAAPPATPPTRDIVWHSELSWAENIPLSAAQRGQLTQLNSWLFQAPGRMVVPLRERSLEIFGDEKVLDSLMLTKIAGEDRLSLSLLRAKRVVPPLHTETVGPGSVLLVVENSDTFDSLKSALADAPGRIGLVGWGAGGGFEASVLSITKLGQRVTEIRYFGDLDRAGLRIPAGADRLARATGLPPVQPAIPLYDALLRHGTPQNRNPPVPAEIADELAGWAAARHRDAISALLRAGRRMAQEAIGATYLQSTDDWRMN